MSNSIKVTVSTLPNYCRYTSSDYILCGLDFYILRDGIEHHYSSQSSNTCLQELLTEIDDYLLGRIAQKTELFYFVPWIMGNHIVYPYSFMIKSENFWTFRYKRNQNDKNFDFTCDISKAEIISLKKQLTEQYAKIDWDSLGKTPVYTFDFSEKEFKWCYSAKELCQTLNDICIGQTVKSIFVGAMNYADPLNVRENRVNYYLGSEVIIKTDDILIDLLIHASGLFELRTFNNAEYTMKGPTVKLIDDGHEELCEIGNVYGAFKINYTEHSIKKVVVDETNCWPWAAKGFDKSKLGTPVELPEAIHFLLENDHSLSFYGWDDDFLIEISPTPKTT